MFVIFFALFIFVFTVFENISLAVIALGIVLLGMILYRRITHRNVKKYVLLILLAFTLSLGSFLRNNYSNPSNIHQSKSFIGSGIIQDTYTEGKYIFSDQKYTYILQSKKEYTIGDEIFLVGRTSSGVFSGSASDQGFLAFDYPKRLKMKGWKGVIYETNSTIQKNGGKCFARQTSATANEESSLSGASNNSGKTGQSDTETMGQCTKSSVGRIRQTKKILQQKILLVYGKNKTTGLILGMLIGDRSQIPKDDYQNFINSGLVHIIAVSGGNIVMIVVFLGLVLFFLPFYIRSGVILLTIMFYGLLCGMDSSVLRAVITGGLSLLALFRGKEVPIWRLLAIAFVGMLLINPYYLVYDVGFIMSFGAVIGIILFSKTNNAIPKNDVILRETKDISSGGDSSLRSEGQPILGGQRASKTIKIQAAKLSAGMTSIGWYIRKNYLQPSIGATLGVFPIIIFFMGKLNLLSVIGNLFVLPILPFVMIYGFVSMFLYEWLGWHRILRIEKMLITYIYKVSELSSSFGLFLSAEHRIKWIILLWFLIGFIVWRIKNE